jgi:hypothetical protein
VADDLQGTTHAEGCHTWGHRHYECALAAIARKDAEIAGLIREKEALVARCCEWTKLYSEQQERAERVEARVAALEESLHYANGVAELAMKHRDAAEARVREAPVARPLELQCKGFDDPDRDRLDAVVKSGKYVALVLLDTEEAK